MDLKASMTVKEKHIVLSTSRCLRAEWKKPRHRAFDCTPTPRGLNLWWNATMGCEEVTVWSLDGRLVAIAGPAMQSTQTAGLSPLRGGRKGCITFTLETHENALL